MRSCVDDERRTKDVDFDAHHRVRGGGHALEPLPLSGPMSSALTAIRHWR
jgi:hypothetical protein